MFLGRGQGPLCLVRRAPVGEFAGGGGDGGVGGAEAVAGLPRRPFCRKSLAKRVRGVRLSVIMGVKR